MQIKHPEWLHIPAKAGIFIGLNQLWFEGRWQKTAGCGPTVATTMLVYSNKRDDGKYTHGVEDKKMALAAMNESWQFIKPGLMGINSTDKFAAGMKKLLRHHKLPYKCQELDVRNERNLNKITNFIQKGIQSDCPVAFLNLNEGQGANFEGWHWITIIGIKEENGKWIAEMYDNNRHIRSDLGLWVSTTTKGGGFVYLEKE